MFENHSLSSWLLSSSGIGRIAHSLHRLSGSVAYPPSAGYARLESTLRESRPCSPMELEDRLACALAVVQTDPVEPVGNVRWQLEVHPSDGWKGGVPDRFDCTIPRSRT